MKKLIDELNAEHLEIDRFMSRLGSALSGADFLNNLLEMESEFINFTKNHLVSHHEKEEQFLYQWMVEQNKNSDKELIKKMIDDHKFFEQKAEWIISELSRSKLGDYQSVANLGFEVSYFLKKYQEHLNNESHFIFYIAEGLEGTKSHK